MFSYVHARIVRSIPHRFVRVLFDTLKLYSIFVPGTPIEGLLGPLSLVTMSSSPVTVCLVSNGLAHDSAEVLRRLSITQSGKLDFLDIPTPRALPHGHALNFLIRSGNIEGRFAFCDPDVFALRAWNPSVMHQAPWVFWIDHRLEAEVGFWGLSSRQSPDGLDIAQTPLNSIDVESLLRTIEGLGHGFESVLRHSQLSNAALALVEYVAPPDFKFDTAKLISYAFARIGLGVRPVFIESLFHIGGLSRARTPITSIGSELHVRQLEKRNRALEALSFLRQRAFGIDGFGPSAPTLSSFESINHDGAALNLMYRELPDDFQTMIRTGGIL